MQILEGSGSLWAGIGLASSRIGEVVPMLSMLTSMALIAGFVGQDKVNDDQSKIETIIPETAESNHALFTDVQLAECRELSGGADEFENIWEKFPFRGEPISESFYQMEAFRLRVNPAVVPQQIDLYADFEILDCGFERLSDRTYGSCELNYVDLQCSALMLLVRTETDLLCGRIRFRGQCQKGIHIGNGSDAETIYAERGDQNEGSGELLRSEPEASTPASTVKKAVGTSSASVAAGCAISVDHESMSFLFRLLFIFCVLVTLCILRRRSFQSSRKLTIG